MASIPPLSQLLNAQTPAQIESALLGFLATAGLPSTAWAPVSVPALMVESNSQVLSALQQQIVNLGYAGYFQLASQPQLQTGTGGTSPWVDLGAQQFYNQLRQQPQATIGPFAFAIVSGAGPYTISALQLKITDATGNVFSNLTPITLNGIGGAQTVIATVQAQTPGAQANITNGTQLTLITSLAGVSVTTSPVSGTAWYTNASPDTNLAQAGANIESDASLIARCINQWSAMGTGSPAGAWLNWIFAASNEVRYAAVQATGLGSVAVTVFGSNNSDVSNPGLAAIAAYLNPRIPNGIFIAPGYPVNAGTLPINPASPPTTYATFSAQLYGPAAAQASALAAAANALTLLIQTTPLGGYPIAGGTPDTYGISNSAFEQAIMNANSAITKTVVSITNYPLTVPPGPAGAGVDLLLPTSGIPTAVQAPSPPTYAGWNLTWNSV